MILLKEGEIAKDRFVWKFLNHPVITDGNVEQVNENIANKVVQREEMELEIWSKDELGFVAVTRPLLWQEFVHTQDLTDHTFTLYNQENQIEKIGTITF